MTEQELLQAIAQAQVKDQEPGEGLTSQEIAETTGLGIKTVRRTLKNMIASGKAQVTWVYRDTLLTPLNGSKVRVPGYVIQSDKEEQGA